jgi:flagellar basal-body rod protein FlgB
MIFKQQLFKDRMPLMNRAMDAYSMRQAAIAKNIANATTEGYKPQKVKFEEFFRDEQSAMSKGIVAGENDIAIGSSPEEKFPIELAQREIPAGEEYFAGESHINIDREMSELAENQIRFRFVSRSMRAYLQGLQSAISGIIR